jgi:tRNA pseudouridine38-40 synthase
MTTRYRAILHYDGTAYHGFQRQADVPTIQAAVERALEQVTGSMPTVSGAGRTDAGVHATGQVIAFDVGWRHGETALLNALNANLPDDIALQDIARAGDTFHPRFSARSRTYQYHILCAPQRQPLARRTHWQMRRPLDGVALNTAAALLIGEHDFAAFGKPPQGENTVRTVIRSEWHLLAHAGESHLCYTVEANAFLQHMVRRMVGLMVLVGRGALNLDAFEALFRGAQLAAAVPLAPPQGLVLTAVAYADENR